MLLEKPEYELCREYESDSIYNIWFNTIQYNTKHYVELDCFLTCAFPTVYHTVYHFTNAFKRSKLFDFFTTLQKVVLKDVPQCC